MCWLDWTVFGYSPLANVVKKGQESSVFIEGNYFLIGLENIIF
jgi:hypothetical protein